MNVLSVCISAALATVLLAGCASDSGIVPVGANTYLITRQAATGFSGLGNLAPDAINEANRYCASRTMVMKLIRMTESKPPYIFGNYPRAEIRFSCIKRSGR